MSKILILVFFEYNIVLELDYVLNNLFCYWIVGIFICEKVIIMISKNIAVSVFSFIRLSFFDYWSVCLVIHMREFSVIREYF